ncbi:hypothetical protein FA10DRAFT_196216 [Acaromyces ingoldii]|uniref:Transcription factor tau subunit sfc3/Tfc3 C-terminal domain-containing protein n=1 Tax=Acaromyces ingoldii TaxID=215250 RepID=A0A316YBI2_9BASI|nr:hypothetical protein FA10DRAFT_196216 [Acaromyces ingoldii]PWN87150.1 hypothetical protein FA10DRAFT_196216 [Acaromyces ingoldii]
MATELIKYLVDEVTSDGLGGSSIARIDGFLDSYSGTEAGPGQVIDESLRRYLVASLLHQPDMVAGKFRARSGASSLKSVKGKAKKRQQSEDDDEDEDEEGPKGAQKKVTKAYDTKKLSEGDVMDTVATDDEAKVLGVDAMVERYGDDFRIALDGTKLKEHLLGNASVLTTPMYYSYLLLLKSRGEGVTFPELGEALNYNAATVFWVGQVLQSNDLAYKIRDHVGKTLVSRLISKKYAHLCPKYNASERYNARMAEGQSAAFAGLELPSETDTANPQEMSPAAIDSLMAGSKGASALTSSEGDTHVNGEDEAGQKGKEDQTKADDSEYMTTLRGMLAYPPVDPDECKALLSDRTVIRLRVMRLLMASRNHSTVLHDLVVRVGVSSAQKNERKIFNSIIKAMEDDGHIERFDMRRTKGMGLEEKYERCIRATAKGTEYAEVAFAPPAEREAMQLKETMTKELDSSVSRLVAETTVERQILEFVAKTGSTGALIDQTTTALGGDLQRRRLVESLLKDARLNNGAYEDLAIATSLEQDRRTRQSRYWSGVSNPVDSQSGRPNLKSLDKWIDLPGEQEYPTSKYWKAAMSGSSGQSAGSANKRQKVGLDGKPPKKGRPTREEAARKLQLKEMERANSQQEHNEEAQGTENGRAAPPAEPSTAPTPATTAQEDRPEETSVADDDIFATGLGGSLASETATKKLGAMSPTPSKAPKDVLSDSFRKNRTVVMKVQMLEDFFQEFGIVESMAMQKQYVDFVQGKTGSQEASAPYLMDRKLRDKLLGELSKQGKVKTTRVASDTGVPGGAKRQRILHWRSDLDLARVAEFSRAVQEGREGFQFSQRTFGQRHAATTVPEGHVDVPTQFYSRAGRWVDFSAPSLDDLVSKPQYRKQLVSNAICRERYAGRIVGSAARLQYLHTVIIGLLLDGTNEYRKERNILDTTWFWTEADLRLYLKLAPVPMNEALLEASQDDARRRLPLKMQDEEIGRALELGSHGAGGLTMIRPMLRALDILGLAKPVRRALAGGYEDCSWYDETTLVRFELEPRHCGIEPSDLSLKQLAKPMVLRSLEDADAFWAAIEKASQPASPAQILPAAVDEDPVSLLGQRRQVWDAVFKNKSSWFDGKNILGSQKLFLQMAQELGITVESLKNDDLMDKLSYASLVPVRLVVRFYEREFSVSVDKRRRSRQVGSEGRPNRALAAGQVFFGPMTKIQAARAKTKEKRARQDRRRQWDNRLQELLDQRGFSAEQKDVLADSLAKTRKIFVQRPEATKGLDVLEESLNVVEEVLYPGIWGPKGRKSKRGETEDNEGDEEDGGHEEDEGAEEDEADQGLLAVNVQRQGKRHMFEWNAARDELLRDACVILRARDKERSSHSLGFVPDARGQTLIERFKRLQSDLGEEAYLAQLEAEWTQIWKAHRGTALLPDEDPAHATRGFELKRHVEFLRENIDKIEVTNTVESSSGEPLPLDIASVAEDWDWERPPAWIMEGKSGGSSGVGNASLVNTAHAEWTAGTWALSMAPSKVVNGSKILAGGANERQSRLAEALVKSLLVTGTEDNGDEWNEGLAVKLCDYVGEDIVDRAVTRLLRRGIVKKKQSIDEGRRLPGRNFAFVEELEILLLHEIASGNGSGSGGSNSRRLMEEIRMHADLAKRAREKAHKKEMVASIFRNADDTEAALAVTLLSQSNSQGDVRAEWDLKPLKQMRDSRMVNGRRMEDFELEFGIEVIGLKVDDGPVMEKMRHFVEVESVSREEQHVSAPSSVSLEEAFSSLMASLDDDDRELQKALIKSKAGLVEANAEGLTADQLFACIDSQDLASGSSSWDQTRLLERVVDCLTSKNDAERLQMAFWTGFDEPRLVWSKFVTAWCLPCDWPSPPANEDMEEEGPRYHFPRLWKDVHGKVVMRVWKRCVKLVALHCLVRPGITRAHLISTLAPLMDRREVVRLLEVVCKIGLVSARPCLLTTSEEHGEVQAWQDDKVCYIPLLQPEHDDEDEEEEEEEREADTKTRIPWYAYATL